MVRSFQRWSASWRSTTGADLGLSRAGAADRRRSNKTVGWRQLNWFPVRSKTVRALGWRKGELVASAEVDAELHDFVHARYAHLRRTAFLLCGDWHRAEDLVQTALTRTVVAARRRRVENLDAFCRTVLLRSFLDDCGRRWRRREQSRDVVPEVAVDAADSTAIITVLAAVRALPPRQRAAVILRYWEDRSIEETADALGVSSGTVKSQCAKGLEALRRTLGRDAELNLTTSWTG
jgi:RNA polymerase sigma-70 factor (sigma-E family)